MREPNDSGIVGWAFSICVAALLVLAVWPALAQAPDAVIIKPVAKCADGKCVMSEADYEKLQKFHAERMAVLIQAAGVIEELQQMNAALLQRLARFAGGCGNGRQT